MEINMKGIFISKTNEGYNVAVMKNDYPTIEWEESDKYWERPLEGLQIENVIDLIKELEEV